MGMRLISAERDWGHKFTCMMTGFAGIFRIAFDGGARGGRSGNSRRAGTDTGCFASHGRLHQGGANSPSARSCLGVSFRLFFIKQFRATPNNKAEPLI